MNYYIIMMIIFIITGAASLWACLARSNEEENPTSYLTIALLAVVVVVVGTLGICWVASQPTRDFMASIKNQDEEAERMVENLQAVVHPELWKKAHPITYEDFAQIMTKIDPTYTANLKANEERTPNRQFFIIYNPDSPTPIVTSKYFLLKGNPVSLISSK